MITPFCVYSMRNVLTTSADSVIILSKEVLFMTATNMNIRMDTEIKAQAQQLFAQFGLDMTTAINMFLRQAIRMRGIPFEIGLDPFYSKSNIERLQKAIADVESGKAKLTEHELIEVEDD